MTLTPEDEYLIQSLQIIRTAKIGSVTYFLLKEKYKDFSMIINILERQQIKVYDRSLAQEEILSHKKIGAKLIEMDMINYPKKLFCFKKTFPIISVWGNEKILDNKTIGIVGARAASVIGLEFTKQLTKKIRDKFTTVSGLALGIDTIVAENSIDNHIGVMPGGLNCIFPNNNHSYHIHEMLSKKDNSCLISCQNINIQAKKGTFPIRNQLIAALSDGLIVTEAKSKSGSLQTAQWAQNYGKPLFVVPGHPMDLCYSGNNQLLKNPKTIPLYDYVDIEKTIMEYNEIIVKDDNYWQSATQSMDLENQDLGTIKTEILKMLSITPVSINHLAHYLNYPIGMLMGSCVLLELEGMLMINSNMTVNKPMPNNFFDDDI